MILVEEKIRIPDIEGLSEEEGKKRLREAGIKYKEEVKYKYSFEERGKIIKTVPGKNEAYEGKEVEIYESKGFVFLLLPLIIGMLIIGLVGAQVIPSIMERPEDRERETADWRIAFTPLPPYPPDRRRPGDWRPPPA